MPFESPHTMVGGHASHTLCAKVGAYEPTAQARMVDDPPTQNVPGTHGAPSPESADGVADWAPPVHTNPGAHAPVTTLSPAVAQKLPLVHGTQALAF